MRRWGREGEVEGKGKGVGGRRWTAAGLGSQKGLLSALPLDLVGASARFGWGMGLGKEKLSAALNTQQCRG
jgi:hypothetical protein